MQYFNGTQYSARIQCECDDLLPLLRPTLNDNCLHYWLRYELRNCVFAVINATTLAAPRSLLRGGEAFNNIETHIRFMFCNAFTCFVTHLPRRGGNGFITPKIRVPKSNAMFEGRGGWRTGANCRHYASAANRTSYANINMDRN